MAKRGDRPTLDEIRQLPVDLTMTVPPQWEDRNGHVNVQYYLGIYHLAGWQILENIGIDEGYLTDQQAGIFDIEHHIRYLTEIKVGEVVSAYNRMLGRDGKRFHGMLFIVNDTCQQLACSIEYLSIYVDQQLRRAATYPEDMAVKLDQLLAEHNTFNWQVPVCGNINI